MRTIIRVLRSSSDGRLRSGFFLDPLRRGLPDAEAERQFSTAIDWGRYGEIYDYDTDSDQVSLDDEFTVAR
ncbi:MULTISPECIES: AAA-associated domain-containing protein [Gordonia]|uniref:AAA-associated domain-containing protein n=1 Tax=Gordonia TaxID=2053 RepID=UPI0022B22B80|nr:MULTISPECIES: AAA-associated domain-containing protein [Gordonia]